MRCLCLVLQNDLFCHFGMPLECPVYKYSIITFLGTCCWEDSCESCVELHLLCLCRVNFKFFFNCLIQRDSTVKTFNWIFWHKISGAIQPERHSGLNFLEYGIPVHFCKNSYKIDYFLKISGFSLNFRLLRTGSKFIWIALCIKFHLVFIWETPRSTPPKYNQKPPEKPTFTYCLPFLSYRI
jgi:hypothetical protein